MSRRRASVLGLLAVLLVLAGCTGVPEGSVPQVVRSVHPSPTDSPQVHITPRPDEGPSDVVRDFVETGVDADAGHSSSRQFLTTGAARRWQDNPTVILDEAIVRDVSVSNSSATVVVTGRRVGSLDASGAFSPILKGMGTGEEEKFTFRLVRQGSQWQIDVLQPGVLINFSDFTADYNQYALYFLDPSGTLVPDLRYSPLQGQALASWLLTELLAGPGQQLAQAVVNEVPDQVGKPTVQIGDPIVVEIPGSAQLKGDDRDGLAKQLAFTLEQARFGRLELTDGGKPVHVPNASGLQFGSSDFAADNPDNNSTGGALYFVRSGALVDGKGVPLADLTNRNFSSVALLRASGESLAVAGLTTTGQLLLGDDRGLAPVSVPQAVTSRPEWRPNTEDVWFGAGLRGGIYRATTGGPVQSVTVSSQVGPLPTGPVTALRFSSDGDRVAMVIRGVNGTGVTWVGSVVTSGSDVRIDSLEPITPPSLAVTDLAWGGPGTLYLVAAAPGAEARVWQMSSDGSQLITLSNNGLSGPPTAITAEPPQSPVVSAGGAIWALSGSTWTSVAGAGATRSSSPIYAR